MRSDIFKFLKNRPKSSEAVTTTMNNGKGEFAKVAAEMKKLTKLYENPSKWTVEEYELRLQCCPSPGAIRGQFVGITMKDFVCALHMIQPFLCFVVAHLHNISQLMSSFCFAHSHGDPCSHMDSVKLLWVLCLIVSVDLSGYHQDRAKSATQLDFKVIYRFPEDGVSASPIWFTDKENLELLKKGAALKKECKYTIAAGQVWTLFFGSCAMHAWCLSAAGASDLALLLAAIYHVQQNIVQRLGEG